jgi:hypothetical protein
MPDLMQPNEDASELTRAYRRPYQPACNAHELLEALRCGALKNPWPFRDKGQNNQREEAA